MKFQSRKFTCGPATLTNVLSVYGIEADEDTVCEHNVDGTSEKQLINGINKFSNLVAEPFKTRDSGEAWKYLNDSVNLGTPVILCVDKWTHWVACIGHLGTKYIIVDPAHKDLVLFYEFYELKWRLKYDNRYYGIAVVLIPQRPMEELNH